jgi:uncharacterized OsmC-like protein
MDTKLRHLGPPSERASTASLATMKVEITRTDDDHLIVDTRGHTLAVHRGVQRDEAIDGVTASELVLGGLGACMLGTALTFARNTDMDLDDIQVTMDADSARHPERLETIRVTMAVTGRLTQKQLASLSRVAARCKIHNTFENPPTIDLELLLVD